MAATRKASKKPASPVIYTPANGSTCGDAFALHGSAVLQARSGATFTASEGCVRSAFHHKEHTTAKPRGLMTAKERAADKAAKRPAKVTSAKASKKPTASTNGRIVVDGVAYSVVIRNGKPSLRRVPVRVIPAADSPRRVAAPRSGGRRAAAAPNGTKSRSNANALKGRMRAAASA